VQLADARLFPAPPARGLRLESSTAAELALEGSRRTWYFLALDDAGVARCVRLPLSGEPRARSRAAISLSSRMRSRAELAAITASELRRALDGGARKRSRW